MDWKKDLHVFVDGRPQILRDLKWNTTAGEVLDALRKQCGKSSPQVLLETWNGCSRPMQKDEFVFRVLDRWGDGGGGAERGIVRVPLVMVNTARYYRARGGGVVARGCGRGRRGRGRLTHGKIASLKRRSGRKRKLSKAAAGVEIRNQIKFAQFQIKKVEKLTKPVFPSLQSPVQGDDDVFFTDGGKKAKHISIPIVAPGSLSLEEEEELIAIREEIETEEQEHVDLVERKRELIDRNNAQERELDMMRVSIAELERKIAEEEARLSEAAINPEMQSAHEEITKIENELKVRTKLNQLQSAKVLELNESLSKTEQEIQQVSEQIEKLRVQLPGVL